MSHPGLAPPVAMSRVYVGLDLDTLFDSGHECALDLHQVCTGQKTNPIRYNEPVHV